MRKETVKIITDVSAVDFLDTLFYIFNIPNYAYLAFLKSKKCPDFVQFLSGFCSVFVRKNE